MIKYITSGDGWGGFNPKDYATIIAQNQGTFVFAKKDIPEIPAIHIGGGSETIVDAMSIVMMLCGQWTLRSWLNVQSLVLDK